MAFSPQHFVWKRIEVVVTSRTRNAVVREGTWVRIPPLPPPSLLGFDTILVGTFSTPLEQKAPVTRGFPGDFAELYGSDGASLYQKSGAGGQSRCLRRSILPRPSITPNCSERFGVIRSFAKLFGLRLLLDLNAVPKGKYHAAIGVHSSLFHHRVPELG